MSRRTVYWSVLVIATMVLAVMLPLGAASAKQQKVSLGIGTVGNELKFDQARLSVASGAKVTVTLQNNASVKALEHNWVLVKAGSEDAVAAAGVQAGSKKSWVPKGDPNVLASMKLVKGGKKGKASFTAPSRGTYAFICSFPGHPITMRGVFEVSP